MKVVIQRVTEASVKVEGNVVGSIGKGLLCLVGIGRDDDSDDLKWCCRKVLVNSTLFLGLIHVVVVMVKIECSIMAK